MPDWKITLTRNVMVNGAARTLQLEADISDTSRNLAIPLGIDELMTREAANDYKLVPKEAVDYWKECRTNGNLQLYEIQTELTTRWGIDFGIQDVAEQPPVPNPVPMDLTHRNGTAEPEISDLDSMLTKHLKALQGRNAVLSAELERKQAEFDRNNADIMRITLMIHGPTSPAPTESITPAFARKLQGRIDLVEGGPAPKKRTRKPKEQPHAE